MRELNEVLIALFQELKTMHNKVIQPTAYRGRIFHRGSVAAYLNHYITFRNLMRTLFLLIFFVILPTTAASTAIGLVTQIRASNSTDQIIFTIDGEIKDAPRCNENSTYTFSLSNEGGRAILELIKISFIEEITISVAGLNTCSRGWKSEGVQDVVLSKPAT